MMARVAERYMFMSASFQRAEYVCLTSAQSIKIITKDDYESLQQLYPSVFPAKIKIVIVLGLRSHKTRHYLFQLETIQSDMRITRFAKDQT
jgi:hypothetical protein